MTRWEEREAAELTLQNIIAQLVLCACVNSSSDVLQKKR